tara:strand:+ start:3582 stop:3734 length:153 start_codon:yes stop_codon:yes gene_type:complete
MHYSIKYRYIVWVGGIDDYYTTYDRALSAYNNWIDIGYSDVQLEKIVGEL